MIATLGAVTVVLVHGTPLDAHAWDAVAELLRPQREVVAYDLRGHGTARATPLPAGCDVLADDLGALLDRLGCERAHVVGHSFGGQVAARFASTRPQRLASLTIVCARLVPIPAFADAAATVEREGIAPLAESALARWFSAEAIAGDNPGVAYARAALAAADPATYATALRTIAAFDGAAGLAAVTAPVRIVAAEYDAVATPELSRAAAALAPDGSFELIAGAGHMLPLEQPRAVAALLQALTS